MNDYLKRQARHDFKESCGYFTSPDGTEYTTKAEGMYFGQLKLCGCGNPEANHALACEIAQCFDREKAGWDRGSGMDAVTELVKLRPEVAAELLVQFLDTRDLFEHGGSVYGSWLTERGKQFIEIGPMAEETE